MRALHLLFASAAFLASGCDEAPPVVTSTAVDPHDPGSTAADTVSDPDTFADPTTVSDPTTVADPDTFADPTTVSDPTTVADTATNTDVDVAPIPRTVRLVPLTERDLLGSETRAFTTLERTLDRAGFDATVATPDLDERAAASAWLDGGGSPRARAWAGVETVVLFELATPDLDRRGRSIPRGSTRILVFRANDRAPRFRLVAAPEAGFVLDGRVGAWLLDLVRGLDEGGPP